MYRRAFFLIVIAALLVEITSCGGSASAPPVSVNVSSGATTIAVDGIVFFSATVLNSSNQAVTWAVAGGASNGTISANGEYIAPANVPTPPTITVTATPQANTSVSGQGNVTVTIGITISTPDPTVLPLQTSPFTANVLGATNQNVTWEVNSIPGGSASVGTISTSGVYQAPESLAVNSSGDAITTAVVTVVAQANTAISASEAVTLLTNNQQAQNLPIELGTSGGNANDKTVNECASGTLGSLVVRAGTQYILSNNHVLADEDTGSIGDAIIQPGLIDTVTPCSSAGANTVANLSQFITLQQPAGCNSNCTPPADAAIAQVVTSPASVDSTGAIIQLGDTTNASGVPTDEAPASTVLPASSLVPDSTAVAKSGRSTGLTCSTVEATDFDVSVQYTVGLGGGSFTALYDNQIAVNGGSFSAAGDSGSLIVSQAGAQPVALLYAGSSDETVGAPVATVLANLGDTSNPQNFPTFVGPATRNAVVGCTSSGAEAFDATAQASAAQLSAAQLAQAEAAKNQNAPQLMSDPAVLAVGVAGSLDRTDRAAVVLFLRKGEPLAHAIPHNVAGVPTRVVAVVSLPQTGVLDQQSTAAFIKTAGAPAPANPTPQQLAAAKTAKEKYSPSLMKQPGILGVGVTSSLDNPSEAAILVFVQTGKPHNPIPLELDGIRVRVKSTDQFRAYSWGHPKPRS
ncbi:MAG: hypothetical protein WA185_14660 [Candidatus Acidiferrales bacterium]